MTNRREFIKQVTAAGVACSMPQLLFANQEVPGQMIWANLLHLSYNMWEDNTPPKFRDENLKCTTCPEVREWSHVYQPFLTFDEPVWNILLKEMADAGMNMVVIDLGDAIRYKSHPEIAVKNAWSTGKLKSELVKIRKMGLEPIPKLNFATTHDAWMGEYSRMVSSPRYYDFCRDLIREVITLFDKPRFFHIGMDEETPSYQTRMEYMVVRQNDLWWNDFYFFVSQVEKEGVRAWAWSDYAWNYPERFYRKMPKSVLQSNWYYSAAFDLDKMEDPAKKYLQLYLDLEAHGYDQVPTGSNHSTDKNMEATVEFCKKAIDPSRLLGFMTAPWRPTLPQCLERHQEAIAQVKRAIVRY